MYLDSLFYRPMGLSATMYCPLKRIPKKDIVPTVTSDFLRGTSLRGIVHDEAAAFMGGVSGNAGLFSTASDLGVIFQMLLDKGICGDQRYLSRATCELFTTMKSKASRRGLGFDRPDAAVGGNVVTDAFGVVAREHPPEKRAAAARLPDLPVLVYGPIRKMNWCLYS